MNNEYDKNQFNVLLKRLSIKIITVVWNRKQTKQENEKGKKLQKIYVDEVITTMVLRDAENGCIASTKNTLTFSLYMFAFHDG